MTNIYCHIGNPKAYSTSIQYYLSTSQKNQFLYLGFKPLKPIDEWYEDKIISKILNYSMRYENSVYYSKKNPEYRKYFSEKYSSCLKSNIDLWISSENLSMRFIMEDIDPCEKFIRMQNVLPSKTNFVIIFRNIWDSLRSIYKEYLKNGYTKDFNDFCLETYIFRESNFLYSLIPSLIIKQLEKNLIYNNKLIPYVIDDSVNKIEMLHSFLKNLTNSNQLDFPHLNKSESYNTNTLLIKNLKVKSNIGASGLIETHRAFWDKKNNKQFENEIWSKLRTQKKNRNIASLNNIETKENLNFYGTPLLTYLKELGDKYISEWIE